MAVKRVLHFDGGD